MGASVAGGYFDDYCLTGRELRTGVATGIVTGLVGGGANIVSSKIATKFYSWKVYVGPAFVGNRTFSSRITVFYQKDLAETYITTGMGAVAGGVIEGVKGLD